LESENGSKPFQLARNKPKLATSRLFEACACAIEIGFRFAGNGRFCFGGL
jgi:hypothetical protein